MLKLVAIVLFAVILAWGSVFVTTNAAGRASVRTTMPPWWRLILAVVVLFFVWTASSSFGVVPAGDTGVRTLFGGKVLDETVGEGLYVVPVGIEQVHILDTKPHKLELDNSVAVTSDRQVVHTSVALIVQIDPRLAPQVYRSYRTTDNFDAQVVMPKFLYAVKTITGRYSAPDQIHLRPRVDADMVSFLREQLAGTGATLGPDPISLVNFAYDPSYQQAIEQTQVAQQNLVKAQNELRVAQVEAAKTITKAHGDATAAQLIAHANNSASIQIRFLDRWDGVLPKVMGGGGQIFDVSSLIGGSPALSPPSASHR